MGVLKSEGLEVEIMCVKLRGNWCQLAIVSTRNAFPEIRNETMFLLCADRTEIWSIDSVPKN